MFTISCARCGEAQSNTDIGILLLLGPIRAMELLLEIMIAVHGATDRDKEGVFLSCGTGNKWTRLS